MAVIVKIYGGLGNQLFQYATALAISLDRNEPLFIHFDKSAFPSGPDVERVVSKISRASVTQLPPSKRNFVFYALWRYLGVSPKRYFETCHAMRIGEMEFPRDVYLEGYWQNFENFKHRENQIRQSISLEGVAGKFFMDNDVSKLKGIGSIAMHVRGGDYFSSKTFATLPPSYYKNAIETIKKRHRLDSVEVYVFSNDYHFARSIIDLDDNVHWMEGVHDRGHFGDLYLLSQFRNIIISNSTFAWWGAWLGDATSKTVVYPTEWLSMEVSNQLEMFPSSWINCAS